MSDLSEMLQQMMQNPAAVQQLMEQMQSMGVTPGPQPPQSDSGPSLEEFFQAMSAGASQNGDAGQASGPSTCQDANATSPGGIPPGMEEFLRSMGASSGQRPSGGGMPPAGGDMGNLFSNLAADPNFANMMASMMGGMGGNPMGNLGNLGGLGTMMGASSGAMGGNPMMGNLMNLMQSMNQPDENVQLLMALKPHLSPERRGKVDEAIQMMRMMHMLRSLSGPKSEGGK